MKKQEESLQMTAVADVDQLIEQYDLALGEFYKGNPEPVQKLWSHRDDATLASPLALQRMGGIRLLHLWSAAHRSSEMARWLASSL